MKEFFNPSYQEAKEKPLTPFQEQLINVWKKINPEALKRTTEEQEEANEKVLTKEKFISDREVLEIAKEYNIDLEGVQEIEKDGEVLFKIDVSKHFSDRRLPEGYGYKGSPARALLLINLGIDSDYTPRDVDVVRLVENEPYKGADDEVAKEFMPEDFEYGDGVERISSEKNYFETRDFTINEVLATDKEVYATRQCILDNMRHIIRLSDFEKDIADEAGGTCFKLLSKMLRFYSEAIYKYGDSQISDIDSWEFEEQFISPFWLALQLDRAYSTSSEVANNFFNEMKETRQIPAEIQTPEEAATYLASLMTRNPFYYRHAPIEQFEIEKEWLKYESGYDNMPKRSNIRRAA